MLGREHAIGHPALTDHDSGLANRLHFELVYSYLFGAGDRGVALTVMLFEMEGFDSAVTDRELLKDIGERIQDNTRINDLVAHLGGARFVLLLLASNVQGGLLAADRLETALSDLVPGAPSFGLAAYSPDMKESSELLAAADAALRRAQEAGGGVEITST